MKLRGCVFAILAALAAAGCGGAVKTHQASKQPGPHDLLTAPGVLHFEGASEHPNEHDWVEYWLDLSTGRWRGVAELPVPIEHDDAGDCAVAGDPTTEAIQAYVPSLDLGPFVLDAAPLLAAAATHPHGRVLHGRVQLGHDVNGALTSVTYHVRQHGRRFRQVFVLRNVEHLPATAENLALTRLDSPGNPC